MSTNTHNTEKQQLLEEAKREFLTEWEQSELQNSTPSLPDFIRRYPSIAPQLLAWATTIVARHRATEQITDIPVASERTMAIINRVKEAILSEPTNLDEAREGLGLSQFKFAKLLRLSPTITKGLGRGHGQHWPTKLEEMLESTLVRPRPEILAMLAGSATIGQQFKASGDPTSKKLEPKTFRQLLEDADRKGELTPEDKQFWIEELDSEGK